MLQWWHRAPISESLLCISNRAAWVRRRQRLQMRAFRAQSNLRNRVGCTVCANVGYIVEPAANFLVRRLSIENQARGAQLRHQRYIEAITQIANEAFDLALRLSSIGLTHLRQV